MARERKLPAGLQKRGQTYYAAFRSHGRLVREKLSRDFKASVKMLNDLRARADLADFGLIDNDHPWKAIKREFLAWARQAVRHPRDYERDLEKFEEYSEPSSVRTITHPYVFGYREWRLAQGATPRTVNREVGTLNNMLNKAVAWKRIGENPIKKLKPLAHDTPVKQRRSLTVAEVESLFANSPEYLKPVWRMFMTTGIRHGELVDLLFSDIDFDRKVVSIRADSAKSRKAREIPLDDTMLAIIADHHRKADDRAPVPGKTPEGRLSKDHVFVTGANTPWRNNLLRAFYSCCGRAGIEGAESNGAVDIHSLRVSFTTLSLEHGAKPKAIQAILGHSTLAMTMGVYAKATERTKREAVAVLPYAKVSDPEHILSMQSVRTVCASENPLTETVAAS